MPTASAASSLSDHFFANPRHARYARLLAGGAVVALAIGVFVLKASPTMPDFEVYWRTAGRAAAGERLYRPEDGHYQFKYLPAFAVLTIPLSLAPHPVAEAIWFSLSLLTLVVLLRSSIRLLPEQRKARWVLVAAAIVVLGKFYAHELVLGQANLLFAMVVTSALLAMKSGRETLAGALVALAIVVKPYGVLLLPWLAARGQPRSIVSAGAAVAAALMLPAVFYGLDGSVALHREWLRTVVDTTAPNLLNVDNVSWLAMFSRWYGTGETAAALAIATTVAAAGTIAWVCRAGRHLPYREGLEGGLLLILVPLMSPQGWDYVLLVSTPAVIYLANYGDRLPRWLRPLTFAALAIVGLTIFDLVGPTAYRAFMRYSGITLCFFVVIAALVTLRRQRIA